MWIRCRVTINVYYTFLNSLNPLRITTVIVVIVSSSNSDRVAMPSATLTWHPITRSLVHCISASVLKSAVSV